MSKIYVGIAERNMLRAVFTVISGVGEIETDDMLEIAALTEALKLDSAEETVQKLETEVSYARLLEQRKLNEIGTKIDKLIEEKETVPDKLYTEFDGQQQVVLAMPSGVSYALLLSEAEPIEYDLDKSTIDWLNKTLSEYKWNQTLARTQEGKLETTTRILSTDEALVAASLVRAVKKAL